MNIITILVVGLIVICGFVYSANNLNVADEPGLCHCGITEMKEVE